MAKADTLFTNALVLTMDESLTQYESGAVAVQGDSILAVGKEADLKKQFEAKEVVDCGGRVLMPGLVNAHTHVPMTLLRGLADDLRLDVWLMGYMMPVEREFVSPDFCRLGTLLACAEMIRSGVTCFADMYYFEEHVARATAEAGLRAVCSQTVLKFPSPDAGSYEDSLAAAREFILAWQDHPLIRPSVGPHAPYTCTADILRACAALAAETGAVLHTHIAETAAEVADWRQQYGMPEVPWVKRQNLFDAKVLAAHCVHVDEGEIRQLGGAGAGVAHCPTSNMKLASGVAPVLKMLEHGLKVGIGTDGTASNNDLDMFEEVRLTALLAKGTSGDPTAVPARQALAMGTRLGAQALHLGAVTGSLEAGKRADLILVDLTPLHNAPRFRHDPNAVYSQLVYASKSTDVTDVMAEGRWLMRDRALLTVETDDLQRAADDYARRIDAFLIKREESVLHKLVAIGGVGQEKSFEVQVKASLRDPATLQAALAGPEIEVVRHVHYHEFDTYFLFDPPELSRLRHREDEFLDEKGEVYNVRYRLTLIGPAKEAEYGQSVLLSRSRFIAPANHSRRFYREYFKPASEREIEKFRLRWLVRYKDTEFFVNLDSMDKPDLGTFVEVKSRTWSRKDADRKSTLVLELAKALGVSTKETEAREYVRIAEESR